MACVTSRTGALPGTGGGRSWLDTPNSVYMTDIGRFVPPTFQKTPDGVFLLSLFPDAFLGFGYFVSH